MFNKGLKHLIDVNNTEYSTNITANKPYRVRNMISDKIAVKNSSEAAEAIFLQIPPEEPPQDEAPVVEPPETIPVEELPAIEAPPMDIPTEEITEEVDEEVLPAQPSEEELAEAVETGYIAVGVFTALGALPVEGAVVTVYVIDEETGEENIIAHLITDANGRVPNIELPVVYDTDNPLASSEYYFTTYNLRVEADGYYTVNILAVRVFPNITTNYRIDMIPRIAGETGVAPDQTFVIPPSPIDISNE